MLFTTKETELVEYTFVNKTMKGQMRNFLVLFKAVLSFSMSGDRFDDICL